MITKSVSLHNTQGTSDKVYHIQIIQVSKNQYIVTFQYGRRGKKLTYGTKTEEPVTLWEAQRIFQKKQEHEQQKGYKVIPDPEDLLTIIGLSY